ncbi:MAG TPA: hypothetical protein QGF58_14045 [Myxococcota bacterium]|nr:hypothetical protein [Myxococcota bacterium]
MADELVERARERGWNRVLTEMLIYRGRAAPRLGLEDAIGLWEADLAEAMALGPVGEQGAIVEMGLGRIRVRQRRFDEAREHLIRALELGLVDEDYVWLYEEVARLCQGDLRDLATACAEKQRSRLS